MGEKQNELERHIHEQRSELGENISELQQKVKTAVDWRVQFREHPIALMGVAFGGGLLLSVLFRGRRSPDGPSENWRSEPGTPDYRGTTSNSARRSDDQAVSTWNNLRGAAVAIGLGKLTSFIETVLPGFQEQYNKRQDERSYAGGVARRPNGPETGWGATPGSETDCPRQS